MYCCVQNCHSILKTLTLKNRLILPVRENLYRIFQKALVSLSIATYFM